MISLTISLTKERNSYSIKMNLLKVEQNMKKRKYNSNYLMTFKEIKLLNYNIKMAELTKENISFFIMMDLFNKDVCLSPASIKNLFIMTSQEIKFLSV
jgi:hypothetical protein